MNKSLEITYSLLQAVFQIIHSLYFRNRFFKTLNVLDAHIVNFFNSQIKSFNLNKWINYWQTLTRIWQNSSTFAQSFFLQLIYDHMDRGLDWAENCRTDKLNHRRVLPLKMNFKTSSLEEKVKIKSTSKTNQAMKVRKWIHLRSSELLQWLKRWISVIYMWRAPKKGGFLGKGRFYRRSDRNGPGKQEFLEKGKAATQLFTIMRFEKFSFLVSMKRASQKLSKGVKTWKPIIPRKPPFFSARHIW